MQKDNPQSVVFTITPAQRMAFHGAVADWMVSAGDDELDRINALREELAPRQVCSLVKLYRLCLAGQKLLERWPEGLVQRLRAANLPLTCAGAPSA